MTASVSDPFPTELPKVEGTIESVWLKTPPRDSVLRRMSHHLTGTSSIEAEPKDFVRTRTKGVVKVAADGLAGSLEFHRQADDIEASDALKRAILVQSQAHVWNLAEQFPNLASLKGTGMGCFGENLTVGSELTAETVCLGDVYKVVSKDASKELCVRVTGPRRPCYSNDRKHGKGVRQACASSGLAGFFVQPLGNGVGQVQEGACLTLVSRPHPSWTLQRVSQVVYGSSLSKDPSYNVRAWFRKQDENPFHPDWLEELRELSKMEELPELEWKEVIAEMLAMHGGDLSPTSPKSPKGKRRVSARQIKTVSLVTAGITRRFNLDAWLPALSWGCVFLAIAIVPLTFRAPAIRGCPGTRNL